MKGHQKISQCPICLGRTQIDELSKSFTQTKDHQEQLHPFLVRIVLPLEKGFLRILESKVNIILEAWDALSYSIELWNLSIQSHPLKNYTKSNPQTLHDSALLAKRPIASTPIDDGLGEGSDLTEPHEQRAARRKQRF